MKTDTILLYPSPGKGHLASMVELGKTLLGRRPSASFSVTIIITPNEADHGTAAYLSGVSETHPDISFLHLPTPSGIVPADFFAPANFIVASYELPRLNNPALLDSLASLSSSGGTSTIKALILDFFCTAAFQVGASLGIPVYYYYTSGACALTDFLYIPTMHTECPYSFKDLDPDTLLHLPGIPPVRAVDMPQALVDRTTKGYGYFLEAAGDMARAAGLIVNTFDSLETRAVKALRDGLCVTSGPTPPLYCVGPLIATGRNIGAFKRHECLRWLDSQPSQSVVFLCFGSMGKFSAKQLNEMALGLERAEVRFIWVVRLPPPDDEAWRAMPETCAEPSIDHFLPEGFRERTKGRGFVAESWAPQMEVLNHGSVGGFVTHCGWNSILEAVCAGVPMLAWPLYGEQKLNRNYIVEETGIALAVKTSPDGLIGADELKDQVTELMSGEKRKTVRDRVSKMKEEAAKAQTACGSSGAALTELIQAIKLGPSIAGESDPAIVSNAT